MAKIKTKTSAGSRDQSKQVYSRIHHLSRELGPTCSTPGEPTTIQTNARPLEAFIPKSQLRTTERYEWDEKKGKPVTRHDPVDVIEHAQRHVSRLKLGNPATSGERQRYREAEAEARSKSSGNKNKGFGGCAPMCCEGDWGKPGSPATSTPLAGGSKRKY